MSEAREQACTCEEAGAGEDRVVICRCEDVALGEIRRLIGEGAHTLDEIKRLTRAGMGLCQGRTCRHLILQEVSRLTGVPVEELSLPAFRPPTRPVRLGVIARAAACAAQAPGRGATGCDGDGGGCSGDGGGDGSPGGARRGQVG